MGVCSKRKGMSDTHIVIMAGGVGSRLYPISTPEKPKQFLDLLGVGKSLIRLTYERFLAVDANAHFWVVTSESYLHYVTEQLPEIPREQILLEPMARNTAPCIAYVCRKIALRYPAAKVVVTPSDAYVPDYDAFALTIRKSLDFVSGGDGCSPQAQNAEAIVTIGITPDRPETGYGYIDVRSAMKSVAGTEDIVEVSAFKEKPSLEVAQQYLAEGGYYWNAGIFVFGVQTMLSELREHAPHLSLQMDELQKSLYTEAEQRALATIFPQCEKISIDYAVMEKSSHIYMAPSDWAWSDLGSFEAIEKITGRHIDR